MLPPQAPTNFTFYKNIKIPNFKIYQNKISMLWKNNVLTINHFCTFLMKYSSNNYYCVFSALERPFGTHGTAPSSASDHVPTSMAWQRRTKQINFNNFIEKVQIWYEIYFLEAREFCSGNFFALNFPLKFNLRISLKTTSWR